jgi:phospholipid transport system substrate-binding protein
MPRAVLLLFVALVILPEAVRAAQAPEVVVERFHAALTEAMKEKGCKDRIDRLEPVIDSTFDMDFIASHILRRRWEKVTAEQRSAFMLMMKNLTVQTYASNFSKPGPTFTTLESKSVSATRSQVRTRLAPRQDDPVTMDYFLQKSGDSWKIINVIANGVSDLALRSSQYDKVFEQQGFDGLMDKLQKQISADRAAC